MPLTEEDVEIIKGLLKPLQERMEEKIDEVGKKNRSTAALQQNSLKGGNETLKKVPNKEGKMPPACLFFF